ncbi:MAG: efflux transporter outer membrane subunit [Alphaproteobacteria bacterium]|nr:MAG: efflux transporter outer membrane subunit [Alphaproteobacteria bacterium]
MAHYGSDNMNFKFLRTGASGLALLLALSACAHPEKMTQSHGIEMRGSFTQAAAQPEDAKIADLDNWLADFQSDELNALVAEALLNNRDIQKTEANVRQARAALTSQTVALLPSLNANGAATRSRSNVDDGMGGLAEVRSDTYSATLDLSWEVDVWGQQFQKRGAAYADYKAASEILRGQRLVTAGTTAQAWISLIEAQESLDLLTRASGIFDQSAQLVRRRYESGLVGALDVRTSEANAAATRASVQQRKQQLVQAQTSLEILLGRYPGGEILEDVTLPALDPVRVEAVPATLLARRPDLAASKASLVAAELRRAAAWKDLLPGFRVTGSAGWREGDVDLISDPERLIWNIIGGVTQPIFNGGQLVAQAKAADARGQEALADYTMTLLDALRDVEVSMAFEREMREQIRYLEQAADQSERAEQIAFDQYSRGLIDIFALQNAQRDSLNRRVSYVSAKANYLRNRVQLYMVLGGSIPGDAPSQIAGAVGSPPTASVR